MGASNSVAGANVYLNPLGWYVCDGTAPSIAASAIWNTVGRYLPNLTDDRFIQGSTTAGSTGGESANSHTHDCDPSSMISESDSATTEVNYQAATPARALSHTHEVDIDSKTSAVASNTENRPVFLACFYIAKVY